MNIFSSCACVMKRVSYLLVVCTFLVGVAACGGGGGSASNGGSSGSEFGIRVMHASIDGVPIEIVSDREPTRAVGSGVFGLPTGYHSLSGGLQTLSVARAKSLDRLVASQAVDVSSKGKYSYLVYGARAASGVSAKLLSDDFPDKFSGGLIRVVHAVLGTSAAAVTFSAVLQGAPTLAVSYASSSEYVAVPAGVIQLSIDRALDGGGLTSTSVPVADGKAYTVLLAGEAGYYVKAVLFNDN